MEAAITEFKLQGVDLSSIIKRASAEDVLSYGTQHTMVTNRVACPTALTSRQHSTRLHTSLMRGSTHPPTASITSCNATQTAPPSCWLVRMCQAANTIITCSFHSDWHQGRHRTAASCSRAPHRSHTTRRRCSSQHAVHAVCLPPDHRQPQALCARGRRATAAAGLGLQWRQPVENDRVQRGSCCSNCLRAGQGSDHGRRVGQLHRAGTQS